MPAKFHLSGALVQGDGPRRDPVVLIRQSAVGDRCCGTEEKMEGQEEQKHCEHGKVQ